MLVHLIPFSAVTWLKIRRKTLSNQSINQSINQSSPFYDLNAKKKKQNLTKNKRERERERERERKRERERERGVAVDYFF